MPTDKLARWAATAVYEDVAVGSIYSTVQSFVKRSGYTGDVDELRSYAHELFMEAVHDNRFDPSKSKFGTFVRNKIWFGLKERQRREIGRNNLIRRSGLDVATVADADQKTFTLDDLDLSEDAKTVIRLVLEEPIDFRMALGKKRTETASPATYRAAAKEVLQDLGWTISRITETFNEIREAL